MIMPFGKHRGKRLSIIPPSYLLWVLDNCSDLQPTLRKEIRYQLEVGDATKASGYDAVAMRLLEPWYRQLAREFHPDSSGSHAAMIAVNRGRDLMIEMTGCE